VTSSIWRTRFLNRWDPPFVDHSALFRAAYQERHFVLNHGTDYGNGSDGRVEPQLRVLLEMVLETFKPIEDYLPPTTSSRNLVAFHAHSLWMRNLLASPFFSHRRQSLGNPHTLFDALQVLFSFLLFSQEYQIAKVVSFARTDYNIAVVYNWNQNFQTLFERVVPGPQPVVAGLDPLAKYRLDLNALLHIRNFWHRHMVFDRIDTKYMNETPEDTFYRTVDKLNELAHVPRAWNSPLQDYQGNLDAIVRGKWVGLYSTVRQWPDKKRDLNEIQTDAAEWSESVEPLVLDFLSTPKSNSRDVGRKKAAIWPDIFAIIPCFLLTVPDGREEIHRLVNTNLGPTYFLQGFAPFMDIEAEIDAHHARIGIFDKKAKGKCSKSNNEKASATHPFNALRLRGMIHPLPSDAPIPKYLRKTGHSESTTDIPPLLNLVPELPIPGFRRIVMVLYKPSVMDLIKQLEYANQDFGSSFTVSVSSQMSPATQQAYQALDGNGEEIPEDAVKLLRAHLMKLINKREAELAKEAFGDENSDTDNATTAADVLSNNASTDTAAAKSPSTDEQAASTITEDDAAAASATAPTTPNTAAPPPPALTSSQRAALWTSTTITSLETGFHTSGQLDWNDIDYAYAYEGVVCPGGNVMLGRWWRAGMAGVAVSDGFEIDQAGQGVPTGYDATERKVERGPFVFWGMGPEED
jgi:hypothetical protein